MILSIKTLCATGLAASVATGGAIATQAPSQDRVAAATASPAEVLSTLALGGEARFSAGDAGDVLIGRTAGGLELRAVNAAAGWLHDIGEGTGREIEVEFFSTGRRIDLNVELEGDSTRVRVRDRLTDDRPGDGTTSTTIEDRDDDRDTTTSTTIDDRDTTTSTTFEDRDDRDTTTSTTFEDRDDRDTTTSTTFEDRDDRDTTTSTTFDARDDDRDDNSGPGSGDDDRSGRSGGGDDDNSRRGGGGSSGHGGGDDDD